MPDSFPQNDEPSGTASNPAVSRRSVLTVLSVAGIGTASFQRAVAQSANHVPEISADTIRDAEWIAGIELTEEQREITAAAVNGVLRKRTQLRSIEVGYDTLPTLRFDPEMFDPATRLRALERPSWLTTASPPEVSVVDSPDPSFLSIRQLGVLLRAGKLTSVDLAKHCLDRLRKFDPVLKCVVTLTEELALKQARQADAELAAGTDRGPLHGIPWGAKDLIAVEDYPTTWGAPQFRDQVLFQTATVAKKLEETGAVLVAKLSLGALAMGDEWFGGQTRNPWNPEQGSSGSSAGSAAAVAAGLVPFALGSETLGSIVSPCRRCGVTGLRPTFGRVSRAGCMSLSWTMDKIGPIARHIDDCAVVFNAIHGADSADPTSVSRWYQWPVDVNLSELKIGKVEDSPLVAPDAAALAVLEEFGANIVPFSLPRQFAESALSLMLDAEAATVFHDLVARNDTEGLNHWPNIFRKLHFLSAVDYLHAARVRSRLMQAMARVFETVDLFIGGSDLGISNLTGHPTVVFPTIMNDSQKHPQPECATLTGRLHDEATLLAVANLIESRTQQKAAIPRLVDPQASSNVDDKQK